MEKACDKQPIVTLISSHSLEHVYLKVADSPHTLTEEPL